MRIVLDTSAILAVGFDEADADTYQSALEMLHRPFISVVTLFEMRTVLAFRKGQDVLTTMELAFARWNTEVVPFDEGQASAAFQAYRRYGKGSGHRAKLNFADCAAYALARSVDAPLLFRGNDFNHTDVTPALPLLVPEAGGRTL